VGSSPAPRFSLLGEHIIGARFVELPGIDYWPWLGTDAEVDAVWAAFEPFLDTTE
jgi:hypothetical protein